MLLAAPPQRLVPGLPPASPEVCTAFEEHNINSSALERFVEQRRADYQAILFLPYLYGTTLRGLALAGDRAYLQPLLHDEPYAFLPQVERMAHQARGLLFASDGEAVFGKRLWGPGIAEKSRVVGHWVDAPPAANGTRVGNFDAAAERYVLYLGRRDETKNIGFAIKAFREYRAAHAVTDLKFVLAGPGADAFPDPSAGIIDLGFVTEAQKHALLAHALALLQPSYNESYSRAMWEAWSHGRPVIVNASCLSTALAVERCDGGWTAGPRSQWVELLKGIDNAHRAFLDRIGQRGFRHYAAHGTIESVFERYESALGLTGSEHSAESGGTVYVLPPAPGLSADAAHSAASLHGSLERSGFTLMPLPGDGVPGGDTAPLVVDAADESAAARALAHPGPLLALFTAPEPLTDEASRAVLARAAAVVSTERNARAARQGGVERVHVLPLACDPSRWDIVPDPAVMASLVGGARTILCVGPVGEGSGTQDAIAAFSFLIAMHCDARMVFVHDGEPGAEATAFGEFVESYGLRQRVTIESTTTPERLAAYYRSASLFLSMSERDDALAPFVDAMLFDVPILAYGTPLVRELLGPAGIIVSTRNEPAQLGALAKEMLRDEGLRGAVIAAQHARRVAFDCRSLDLYVEGLMNELRSYSVHETA